METDQAFRGVSTAIVARAGEMKTGTQRVSMVASTACGLWNAKTRGATRGDLKNELRPRFMSRATRKRFTKAPK